MPESYRLRVKGRTYGHVYIRRGSHNLTTRNNGTNFPTKAAALEYKKRYVDVPVIVEASGREPGQPKYKR